MLTDTHLTTFVTLSESIMRPILVSKISVPNRPLNLGVELTYSGVGQVNPLDNWAEVEKESIDNAIKIVF